MAVQYGNRKYPKLAYTRNATDSVNAILSKLVRDQSQVGDRPSDPRNITVSRDLFEQISQPPVRTPSTPTRCFNYYQTPN